VTNSSGMNLDNRRLPGGLRRYGTIDNAQHLAHYITQDHALMESNWAQSDEASMSNPLGGIKRGWNEIKNVYHRIFNGSAVIYVEFYDYSLHLASNSFVAVGRERGSLEFENNKIELEIRTSRIYLRDGDRWGPMETAPSSWLYG